MNRSNQEERNFEMIFKSVEATRKPEQDWVDSVEKKLVEMTAEIHGTEKGGRPDVARKRRIAWLGTIAAATAVLILFALMGLPRTVPVSQEISSPQPAATPDPPFEIELILPDDRAPGRSGRSWPHPTNLDSLIKASHAILGGSVEKRGEGKYVMLVRTVFLGDELRREWKLEGRPKLHVRSPAPPTFEPGEFQIVFILHGQIPTDDWIARFDDLEGYTRFSDRLRRYMDGSILPELLVEIEDPGSPGPYRDTYRLLYDLYTLLGPEDVDLLCNHVREHSRSKHLVHYLHQLVRIDGGEKTARLLRQLIDGSLPVSVDETELECFLPAMGEKYLDGPSLGVLLEKALDRSIPVHRRQRIVLALGRGRIRQAAPTLRAVYERGAPEAGERPLMEAALQSLGMTGGDGVIEFMTEVFHETSGRRELWCKAAAALGSLGAYQPLIDYLQKNEKEIDDERSYQVAVSVLGWIDHPSVRETLRRIHRQSGNAGARYAAAEALLRLGELDELNGPVDAQVLARALCKEDVDGWRGRIADRLLRIGVGDAFIRQSLKAALDAGDTTDPSRAKIQAALDGLPE